MVFFCVFKQKTAYEMRISDWSSDVCSSDLPRLDRRGAGARGELERRACRPVNKVADGIEEKLVMAEHDHLCGLVRFTGSHDLFGGHCSAEVIEAGEGEIGRAHV